MFFIISQTAFALTAPSKAPALKVNAKGAYVVEANSGKVLFSKDENKVLPIASVTKIMTYYVFKDYIDKTGTSLDKVITLKSNVPKIDSGETLLGLKKGTKITVRDLIKSVMIMSANDSALFVTTYMKGYGQDTIALMNKKAKQLGLTHTKFFNSAGLSQSGGRINVSTAKELSILARSLIKNHPEVLDVTSCKTFSYAGRQHKSTNPMLRKSDLYDGLKTGYTKDAGFCIITTADFKSKTSDDKSFRPIFVILGCPTSASRLSDCTKLSDYVSSSLTSKDDENKTEKPENSTEVSSNSNSDTNKILFHKEDPIDLNLDKFPGLKGYTKTDVLYPSIKEENISYNAKLNITSAASVKKDDIIGTLQIVDDKGTVINVYKLYKY